MEEFKEKLSTTRNKLHLVFWCGFWAVTIFVFVANSRVVVGEGEDRSVFGLLLYIGMLVLIALSILYCLHRWLHPKTVYNEKGKAVPGKFTWRDLIIFAIISFICFLIMELINNSEHLLEMKPLYVGMNVLGCMIMMLICMGWFNSHSRAALTMVCFTTGMSLIFYYVYLCRGEPLQFIDVFAFGTAMEVAGGYPFVFSRWVTVCLTGALCLIGIILHWDHRAWAHTLKWKLISRAGTAGFMVLAWFLYLNLNWNGAAGIVTDLWAPHDTYQEVGTNVGFFCVAKFMRNEPPEGYSVSAAERIAEESAAMHQVTASEGDGQSAGTDLQQTGGSAAVTKPVNIIAIMNEAWADYAVFDKFATNQDYEPFYESMDENTIKGHTLVCISGGGTAKTEYEFLTGNSVKQYPGMVPYVSYYTHDQYSLVSTLEAQGYQSAAMHPNKGTNWNRDNAYRLLGFDTFYTIDDFDEDTEKIRGMVSDKANYEKIIEVIENKGDPDQPFFLFDVTMQNHGGYSSNNYPTDVRVEGYSDDAWNRYLSLVKESDEALQYLIEYFENCDEPTMIVMFGDHFPSQDAGVEKYLSGDARDRLELEESQQYYQTPFFIWTNYEMDSAEDVLTSTNFLGTLMMEQTGLAMTPFEEYQQDLMEDISAYNHKGYVAPDGEHVRWVDATEEVKQEVLEYEYLQYNALMENGKRLDWFFTVPDEKEVAPT